AHVGPRLVAVVALLGEVLVGLVALDAGLNRPRDRAEIRKETAGALGRHARRLGRTHVAERVEDALALVNEGADLQPRLGPFRHVAADPHPVHERADGAKPAFFLVLAAALAAFVTTHGSSLSFRLLRKPRILLRCRR